MNFIPLDKTAEAYPLTQPVTQATSYKPESLPSGQGIPLSREILFKPPLA